MEPPAVETPPASLQREKEPVGTPRAPRTTTPGYFDVEEAPPREAHRPNLAPDVPATSPSSRSETVDSSPRGRQTRSQTGSLPTPRSTSLNPVALSRRVVNYAAEHTQLYQKFYESTFEPFIGKANKKNPDIYTWEEAMASPHREEFLKAMDNEVEALTSKTTWTEEDKMNATTPIVPSLWCLSVKRAPSGEFKKFKARLTLRGDLQEDTGRDNYSPVASWSTIRFFLVWTLFILGWTCVTIDFSNAFVQSKLPPDEPVWMHIPRGYKSTKGPNTCLRLNKSLYGHRRAPQLWFEQCGEAFKKLGLKQSAFDPCLWYGKDILLVQYVDDCGIAAPNQTRINKFVSDLKAPSFELTQEETFAEFLGIQFHTHPDGSMEMTQTGLINKTLAAAGMSNCNPNAVPASQATLGADLEGEPMDETWNYRAICGMLLYLSTNTRPDIAFAVSQVCRFGHNPKKSHASAIKTILRYLKGTANKGILVKPFTGKLALDLYVDSDFCGLFGRENARDPNSVRSRTGYIILFCGWPIIWKSQLQTHLSQSTLEAEYSTLSSSLRTFLPLKRLVAEMVNKLGVTKLTETKLHSTVFEDNQSTYFLATNQRITSRTKYLLAKWHWFWAEYNKGEFAIVKCPTNKQLADYMTKPLAKVLFQANRNGVQNW